MVLALAEARKDGRVRLVRINDNRTETLLGAIRANVAAGSSVTTDGWRGYNALPRAGYPHTRLAHPKNWTKTGRRSTPHADEVISASKRWLVGTYQKPARAHLPVYLAEFCFRREIRDPGARFEALLRALMASPVRTRTHAGCSSVRPRPRHRRCRLRDAAAVRPRPTERAGLRWPVPVHPGTRPGRGRRRGCQRLRPRGGEAWPAAVTGPARPGPRQAWLAHVAWDRAFGFGLRTPDGRQRGGSPPR